MDAPRKLRLPERTATGTILSFDMASAIGFGNGPELPMQVVQP